jgi:NAD(P)-dependent dehydrogenase (short-subunit alcohol dehydrogenase family)
MGERKKVIVAGSSSGIGEATAIRFAREGWNVCLNARRAEKLLEVREKLAPGHHLVCPGDAGAPSTGEKIRAAIESEWEGGLDALVNSVGVWMTGDAIETPLAEWRGVFDLLVNSAINLTRTAVPLMPPGGRVIHITSIHGTNTENGAAAYSMAKAAINQYCRSLAIELAPKGILVNAIAPGFVETPMSIVNGVSELESEWFRQNYVAGYHLPLKRAGQPEEIAGVAFFLAGPDATYLTGQVITVDGGLTITF